MLVGPDFLFKLEHRSEKPGIYPLGQYELASRLSYFLWSTMPDDELNNLAAQGRLQDPKVLAAQVDRMLDDPESRTFTSTFIGQWLGTQDLGGRVAPMLTELQAFYTPPVAADLRAEPILLFERILGENRSILELLTARLHLHDRAAGEVLSARGPVQGCPRQPAATGEVARQPPRRRDESGRGDGDDLALPADQPGAARRVGARDAARDARPAAAAERARARARQMRRELRGRPPRPRSACGRGSSPIA